MSILTIPKDNLNPELWDYKQGIPELKVNLRKEILNNLPIVDEPYVTSVELIGGSASYQWSDTSDIDITVAVDFAEYCRLHNLTHEVKEIVDKVQAYLTGLSFNIGHHAVHYHIMDSTQPPTTDAQYNLITGLWTIEPLQFPKGFDPKVVYRDYLTIAISWSCWFKEHLQHFKSWLNEYATHKEPRVFMHVADECATLVRGIERVTKNRQKFYALLRAKAGKDIVRPDRFSVEEIVYKYLEQEGLYEPLNNIREYFKKEGRKPFSQFQEKDIHAVISLLGQESLAKFVPDVKDFQGKPVDVFKNPTPKELREVYDSEGTGLRAFLIGKDIYVWENSLHANVQDTLKLSEDRIPLDIYTDGRKIHGVQVTDHSKRTKWHHNPEVIELIKDHPFIKAREDDDFEIFFYDEDVVGKWDELSEAAIQEPTEEMKEFYKTRTKEHIDRVIKNAQVLEQKLPELKGLVEQAKKHDVLKYGDAEYLPYVWLTEYHRKKNEGKPFEYPAGVAEEVKKATHHHVHENKHHPEAHSTPDDMSQLDIAEMIADWNAMSQELGNSLKGWADKHVGSKWKFNKENTAFIYKLIEILSGVSADFVKFTEFFVGPEGEYIPTPESHVSWICFKAPLTLVQKMEENYQKVIKEAKKLKNKNTSHLNIWINNTLSEKGYYSDNGTALQNLLWDFIDKNRYVRAFGDSLYVPDRGMTRQQLQTTQEKIDDVYTIIFAWKDKEFRISINDFKAATKFADVVKNKLTAGNFNSEWIAPDGKEFSASHAGHQDWIDTHEDLLVEEGYFEPEEIPDTSIDYLVEHGWVRVIGDEFVVGKKEALLLVLEYVRKHNKKNFKVWTTYDEDLGDFKDYNALSTDFENVEKEISAALDVDSFYIDAQGKVINLKGYGHFVWIVYEADLSLLKSLKEKDLILKLRDSSKDILRDWLDEHPDEEEAILVDFLNTNKWLRVNKLCAAASSGNAIDAPNSGVSKVQLETLQNLFPENFFEQGTVLFYWIGHGTFEVKPSDFQMANSFTQLYKNKLPTHLRAEAQLFSSFKRLDTMLQDFVSMALDFGFNESDKVMEEVNKCLKEQVKKNSVKVIITPKYKYKIIREVPIEDIDAQVNDDFTDKDLKNYNRILMERRKNVFKTKLKQWLIKYIRALESIRGKYQWLEIRPLVEPFTNLKWSTEEQV